MLAAWPPCSTWVPSLRSGSHPPTCAMSASSPALAWPSPRSAPCSRTASTPPWPSTPSRSTPPFAPKWRPQLQQLLQHLPAETRRCVDQELELLDLLQTHIRRLEARILERVELTHSIQLLMPRPGPGGSGRVGRVPAGCKP